MWDEIQKTMESNSSASEENNISYSAEGQFLEQKGYFCEEKHGLLLWSIKGGLVITCFDTVRKAFLVLIPWSKEDCLLFSDKSQGSVPLPECQDPFLVTAKIGGKNTGMHVD